MPDTDPPTRFLIARDLSGMSARKAVDLLGCSFERLAIIERGYGMPSDAHITTMANIYGVREAWLRGQQSTEAEILGRWPAATAAALEAVRSEDRERFLQSLDATG